MGGVGEYTPAPRTLPTQIWLDVELYPRRVTAIAAGDTHSVAIVDDGYLYTWGSTVYSKTHSI
jgi:alpha-tubulin suppressor-like RCC1 family protein